jgi:hypothetical protein
MGRGSEMKQIFIVLQIAILIGCSSKDVDIQKDRFLYFTSTFPSDIHWEVTASFSSNRGIKLLCQDFSMGSGQWEQSIKSEHSTLSKSGDTLKVPLFWPKNNTCDWKLTDLLIDSEGRHIRMPQISLINKSNSKVETEAIKLVPATLTYLCTHNTQEDVLYCAAENSESDNQYLLNDSLQINRFRIDLKGFKPL